MLVGAQPSVVSSFRSSRGVDYNTGVSFNDCRRDGADGDLFFSRTSLSPEPLDGLCNNFFGSNSDGCARSRVSSAFAAGDVPSTPNGSGDSYLAHSPVSRLPATAYPILVQPLHRQTYGGTHSHGHFNGQPSSLDPLTEDLPVEFCAPPRRACSISLDEDSGEFDTADFDADDTCHSGSRYRSQPNCAAGASAMSHHHHTAVLATADGVNGGGCCSGKPAAFVTALAARVAAAESRAAVAEARANRLEQQLHDQQLSADVSFRQLQERDSQLAEARAELARLRRASRARGSSASEGGAVMPPLPSAPATPVMQQMHQSQHAAAEAEPRARGEDQQQQQSQQPYGLHGKEEELLGGRALLRLDTPQATDALPTWYSGGGGGCSLLIAMERAATPPPEMAAAPVAEAAAVLAEVVAAGAAARHITAGSPFANASAAAAAHAPAFTSACPLAPALATAASTPAAAASSLQRVAHPRPQPTPPLERHRIDSAHRALLFSAGQAYRLSQQLAEEQERAEELHAELRDWRSCCLDNYKELARLRRGPAASTAGGRSPPAR